MRDSGQNLNAGWSKYAARHRLMCADRLLYRAQHRGRIRLGRCDRELGDLIPILVPGGESRWILRRREIGRGVGLQQISPTARWRGLRERVHEATRKL